MDTDNIYIRDVIINGPFSSTECASDVRAKLGRRLLIEALFGYLFVVAIYIGISIRVVYGNRGVRPFWADLKARMFGNDAYRK
jgi:hypothetical protein